MKFISIMIMALLLAGIGSAQNYMPEFTMEPGADLSMFDGSSGNFNLHDGNITADWPLYEGCLIYNIGSVTHAKNPYGELLYSGTDPGVAIQSANDYLTTNHEGGKIIVLQGNYNVTPITLDLDVKLVGAVSPWRLPADAGTPLIDFSHARNVKFYVTNTTTPAITVKGGNEISNIVAAYPDQQTNTTPDAYPAFIYFDGTGLAAGVHIHDVDAGNSYIFLECTGTHSNIVCTDIFGYPLYRGFIIDDGRDSDYFTRCHFAWSYYPEAGTVLKDWVMDNTEVFQVGRADNTHFTNCFHYGYKTLFNFTSTTGVECVGCASDGGNPCVSMINCSHVSITGGSYAGGVLDHSTDPGKVCNSIYIYDGTHNKIEGATISSTGSGIYSEGTSYYLKLVGNDISLFGSGNVTGETYGIILVSVECGSVIGNSMNGDDATDTVGIMAGTGTSYALINSNSIFNVDKWGLAFAAAASYNLADGTFCYDCDDGIADFGTGNQVNDSLIIP